MSSTKSLKFQIKLALGLTAWGNNTLPQPLDETTLEEKVACLETCLPFLLLARSLSGHKLLVELLNQKITMQTLHAYYRNEDPLKNQSLLDALDKLYQGCVSKRWKGIKKKSPIAPNVRQFIQNFRKSSRI